MRAATADRAPIGRGGSVRRVRRLAVLALASAIATAGALGRPPLRPAAHICAQAVQIPVGQPSTIAVGVTVEGTTVPDVDHHDPAGPPAESGRRQGGLDPDPHRRERPRSGVARSPPTPASTSRSASPRRSRGRSGSRSSSGPRPGRSSPARPPISTSPQSRVLDQFVYAGVTPPSNDSGSRALR